MSACRTRSALPRSIAILAGLTVAAAALSAQSSGGAVSNRQFTVDTFRGLAFRSIGPSITTGRISDLEIDPNNRNVWYLAVGSGGLWKTVNRGNTWTPIF